MANTFLQNYIQYNSANECPRNYHLWTGLVVLSATLGRRVFIKQGYFDIHPNLYVCLVGKQGNRKSTAKDIGRDLFCKVFPDYPVGASVQSREDIVKRLASDDLERVYVDHTGATISYKPLILFINELKNFLSVNPSGMIDFLTDIYDRRMFDAGTIKHGLQIIENPCINMLACETPKWIIDKLKLQIISGGFSRRMIYVYEIEEAARIPFPNPSADAKEAYVKCITHLQTISKLTGEFMWTPQAREYYSHWYTTLKFPDDEVMEGYYRSKHIQLLKICMGLAAAEPQPKLELTVPLLEHGIALLNNVEINMPKLSIAAGRNELAVPTQNLTELIEKNGGLMDEKELLRKTSADLGVMEQLSVLRFLCETDQLIRERNKDNRVVVYLPTVYAKMKSQTSHPA